MSSKFKIVVRLDNSMWDYGTRLSNLNKWHIPISAFFTYYGKIIIIITCIIAGKRCLCNLYYRVFVTCQKNNL